MNMAMPVKPIRTRADHHRALVEIERLMGARRGSPQADRLEVLAALVAAYEATHDPIDLPEPIEAIGAHMNDHGLGQADLARLLGSRSLASAILNRKRAMSLSVIRKLAREWDIPTDILVQPYRLEGDRSPRAA
jgi:HTH-type transcriptional regulator/antitoxin HigA